MQRVYDILKSETQNKGLRFAFKSGLPIDNAIIVTDKGELKTILTNLVKNAIKYTDAGFVEFGYQYVMQEGKKALEFYVKDTFIGIAIERQAAIFERFIQADIEDIQAR